MKLEELSPGDVFDGYLKTDTTLPGRTVCIRLRDGLLVHFRTQRIVDPVVTEMHVTEIERVTVEELKPGDKFSWNTHVMILTDEYDSQRCTHTCVNLKTGYTLPLHRNTRAIRLEAI